MVQPNSETVFVRVLLRAFPLAGAQGPCLPAGGHSVRPAGSGESQGKRGYNRLLRVEGPRQRPPRRLSCGVDALSWVRWFNLLLFVAKAVRGRQADRQVVE